MVEINYPPSVKRGESVAVSVRLNQDDVKGARAISLCLLHELKYPNPCRDNFSYFSEEKKFEADKAANGILEATFQIPAKAPPSANYGQLTSRWVVDVKMDIPFWFDKHTTKEINVRR